MSISHVLLFLTYRCNLRCEFCLSFNHYWSVDSLLPLPVAADPSSSLRSGSLNREMSTANIVDRVIPQCEKNGVEVIALSGGEVLMRRDAPEIFRALGASSLRWCLDSNLMLCNETIAEAIIDSSCDTVFVSFDGGREIHNKLRRSNKAFDKALHGLQCLIETRKKLGKYCEIAINFVLQPGNEHELEKVVELAFNCGVDKIGFQMLSKRTYTTPFNAKAAVSSLSNALALAKTYGLRTSVFPLLHPNENDLRTWYSIPLDGQYFKSCTYIHKNLRIDPMGNVIPCIEYKLGNILEQELSEIWTGDYYQIFRENIVINGPFEACLRCCNMNSDVSE